MGPRCTFIWGDVIKLGIVNTCFVPQENQILRMEGLKVKFLAMSLQKSDPGFKFKRTKVISELIFF
jgi:hypothetical protein